MRRDVHAGDTCQILASFSLRFRNTRTFFHKPTTPAAMLHLDKLLQHRRTRPQARCAGLARRVGEIQFTVKSKTSHSV
jgi:hypothetical protein